MLDYSTYPFIKIPPHFLYTEQETTDLDHQERVIVGQRIFFYFLSLKTWLSVFKSAQERQCSNYIF